MGKLNISETKIYAHRLNVAEISTAERDMLVMATIEAGVRQVKNLSRKKVTYRSNNTEVCIDTFLFIYAISGKHLKIICAWYLANGLVSTHPW